MSEPERVGHFRMAPRNRGERPLRSAVYGLIFDRIEVLCAWSDYIDPKFQEWVCSLHCRLADPRVGMVTITVV